MHEVTTPRSLVETTTSALVPGAHIEVAFQKLGKDISKYVKGSGALPYSIGNERGYYSVDSMPVLPESFPEMLESLYRIQSEGSEIGSEIAQALIENLTTRNDITDEELSVLWHIAEKGEPLEFQKVTEATPGMAKALGKIKFAGNCSNCGFKIPKYAGRYPKRCPECGEIMQVEKRESSVDPQAQLTPGNHRESLELAEAPQEAVVEEVYQALDVLNERLRLVSKFGLKRDMVHEAVKLPGEATALQRVIVGETPRGDVQVSPQEVFESLIAYVLGEKRGRFDNLVRHLFTKLPLEEGMTERLRSEVAKRPQLVKSIKSLSEGADDERRYFALNKALSSCYTRVMIEGETMGGENFKLLGKCIFEMMQRALEGDLRGPTRFLNLYFLEG